MQRAKNNNSLGYWVSNTSTLLCLMQRSFKPNKDWKPPVPQTFFGRMALGFRSSSSSNIQIDIIRPVEPKQPALLFKQQLTAFVEMLFGILRDNFKEELLLLLSSCIQAPKAPEEASSWQVVIDSLNSTLNVLKENHVPKALVQNIFSQLFSCINVQVFNSLLCREFCTFKNGQFVKAGLDKLETWCGEATEEFIGSAWDELKHTRQAVGFLVTNEKAKITYEDLTTELCPLLGVPQIYRICSTYSGDESVSPEVIKHMKEVMTGVNEADLASDKPYKAILLEDNTGMPMSMEDLSSTPEERDFAGVKPPSQLLELSEFQFLQESAN